MFDSQTANLNSAFARIEEDKRRLREEGLLTTNEFVVGYTQPRMSLTYSLPFQTTSVVGSGSDPLHQSSG